MKKQNIFSFIFFCIVVVMVKFLGDMVFLLASCYLIAIFLNPLVLKLYQETRHELLSVSIVFLLFWGIIITCLALALPHLYGQLQSLIHAIPKYKTYVESVLIPFLLEKTNINGSIINQLSNVLEASSKQVVDFGFSIFSDLWSYTIATIHACAFVILLPLTSFYILREIDKVHSASSFAAKMLNPLVLSFLRDCIKILGLYLKGQMNVCIIMGLYYSVSLSLVGIDFALIIGLVTGLAIAVPFIGTLISFIFVNIITVFDFGISREIIYVCLVYLIGQGLEGYFITPKIVGEKIGISPIVMIIALICWGKLLGLTGVLFAIPLTCVVKVATEHIIKLLTKPINDPAKF